MENMTSVAQGFTKSLAMTVLSEIGDKTFFAAAILAMRHPRRFVLSGCLSALIVMTIISAVVGWAAPNLISRTWTHHITTILFFGFGLWSLWDGFNDKGEAEELAEVEAKLDADWKAAKGGGKDNDDLKKQRRKFLSQFFSPIFLKAFSITFFGEWGDKSQIATIGLAADENPFGVVIGGILASSVYYCRCHRWKELGISNIRENSCVVRWSSFYCFWNPIRPCNGGVDPSSDT
uniref:GDT1 family protein n=1 Tax=Salix viminalis TaxID=40686 RepID=A0A6N2MEJ9_SALVM